MDAASARIMDKQLLEGALPGADPLRLWDSYGTGLLCDGCDVAITRSEKEQAAEMPNKAQRSGSMSRVTGSGGP
jgi:hypothetical protein